MKKEDVKQIVKEGYSDIAKQQPCGCSGCCGNAKKEFDKQIAKQIGYSDEEISNVPEANMGLGCENTLALSNISPLYK